jgi:hypothetical protein
MTFKRRVLIAYGAMIVAVVLGNVLIAATDAPESSHQVLIGLVGVPLTLYVTREILRERGSLRQRD